MKTKLFAMSFAIVMAAASSDAYSKSYKRSQFSKAEQAKIFAKALAGCRKKYGDRLHNVEVNYAKGYSTCYIY
jgi:hypothetical protein